MKKNPGTVPTRTEAQKAAASKAAALKRNPDGVHRAARSGRCRHCRAPVFTGLDGDMCALNVTVDVAPLSAAGEVLALMGGRMTYSLAWRQGRGRYEIDPRNHYNIEDQAPGENANIDVVTGHQCGAPQLPRLETMMRRQSLNKPPPIDPPY